MLSAKQRDRLYWLELKLRNKTGETYPIPESTSGKQRMLKNESLLSALEALAILLPSPDLTGVDWSFDAARERLAPNQMRVRTFWQAATGRDVTKKTL
jgi:hypothetical protein